MHPGNAGRLHFCKQDQSYSDDAPFRRGVKRRNLCMEQGQIGEDTEPKGFEAK